MKPNCNFIFTKQIYRQLRALVRKLLTHLMPTILQLDLVLWRIKQVCNKQYCKNNVSDFKPANQAGHIIALEVICRQANIQYELFESETG